MSSPFTQIPLTFGDYAPQKQQKRKIITALVNTIATTDETHIDNKLFQHYTVFWH